MHSFFTSIILSFFILVPAAVGIYRFRSIDKIFYPFLCLLWLGLFNELLSLIFSYTVKTTMLNSNIYVLLDYILVIYQFRRWNDSTAKPYIIIVVFGVLVWIADNLLLNSVFSRNGIFRIFYSFVVIFCSINQVNKLIVYERRSLLKNPVFLICLTFLIYYSYKAFLETFIAFNLNLGSSFNENVVVILGVTNFISNVLFTIALLCIPPKLEFTLPY